MKKIFKAIFTFFKKIFSGIYKIIDKILVTPISKLLYKIINRNPNGPSLIDRMLNKPNMIVYISLALAFITFILIDRKVVVLVETEAIVIPNQTVVAEYNEESFVVEGIPETADIVLMGRKSDLYLAQQLGDHSVSLDLSGLGVGTHKVNLKYTNSISSLTYKLDPSSVTVVIYPIVREFRTVTTDIINTDKLGEKLLVSSVTLDRDEVIIKSYAQKLETVASVKAIVDVNALSATSAGTYTLENVKLVAYDDKGTEIKDVEILPETLTATVIISSPNKTVPIKIVPIGEVASGSAIASINSNITKVTVYAEESVLATLDNIEVTIDVNGLNADKTYQTSIEKPLGVRSISEKNVTVKVTMEKEASKEFEGIPIELKNLGSNLKAFGKTENDTKVTVIVKGTSTLLNALTAADIKAYVDLTDLKEGEWEVGVTVTGNDLKLSYTPKTQKVKIIITK